MRKKLLVIAAATTLLGLALGTRAASASGSDPAGETIDLAVKFVNDNPLDLPPQGPSQGDQLIFYDLLFNNSGKQVGYSAGSCTIANLDPVVAACAVTSQLPGGQIATQFLTTPGPAPKIVAVTGGTGSYRNVRGSARLVEHGDGTGTLTFHLLG
jgi:hypothetical protein